MTVTPPLKSAKKRARNELEEDERRIEDAAITTPSKASKRQNMSKTPVRMKMTPPLPHRSEETLFTPPSSQARGSVPAVTTLLPPRSGAPHGNQNTLTSRTKNKNIYSMDKADSLVEPPPPPPVTPTQMVPRDLPTSPEKPGDESLIIRGMGTSTKQDSIEVSQEYLDEEGSPYYAGICILLLVILLAFVSGVWSYERMSSQITIGTLRQDLQNCRALHSQEAKQDQYYIKELETEVRVWRQEAKAKHVELEALRTECQLSKESE